MQENNRGLIFSEHSVVLFAL